MPKAMFDLSALTDLANELDKNLASNKDKFMHDTAKMLGYEYLKRVQDKTPIGNYDGDVEFTTRPKEATKEVSFTTKDGRNVFFIAKNPPKSVKFKNPLAGKQGGDLRKAWEIAGIVRVKDGYEIPIHNPLHYAPHVEYGHRIVTKNGEVKGFVKGRFMMKRTNVDMEDEIPKLLEKRYNKFINEVMKN